MATRVLLARLGARVLASRALYAPTLRASGPKSHHTLANPWPAFACAAGVTAGSALAFAASPSDSLTKEEVSAAANAIHELLDNEDDMGPTLVRLAWHASGTYDKDSGSGGSDGATMRFKPESHHDANAGLEVARSALEPVKKLFPSIS